MAGHIGSQEIKRIVEVDLKFTAYNNFRTLRLEDGDLEKTCFGNATALRDRTHTEIYYNRVVGFGEADIPHLEQIIAFHHSIGKTSTISLTPDQANSTVLQTLQQRGYNLLDTNYIFAMPCSLHHHDEFMPNHGGESSPIEIRRACAQDIDVVVALWSLDSEQPTAPEVIQRRAAAQWLPEFPIYVAQLKGRVVAKGSMYIADGIAWLGNAETFPAFRRRGCQLALLKHRIREAAALGCDWAIADTEFGTISQRNLERAGLGLAYIELIFGGPKPEGTLL